MHKILKIFLALVLAVMMTVEVFPVNTVRAEEEEVPVTTETAEPVDTAAEEENQDNDEVEAEVTEAPAQTEEEETPEAGEVLRGVEVEEPAKVILDVTSNGVTVSGKVFANYSVRADLPAGTVNASGATITLTMNDVASLGISGSRSYSASISTGVSREVPLASALKNIYKFSGATVNATVKDITGSKSASWTLEGSEAEDGGRTIVGTTEEDKARAAWQFLANDTHFDFTTKSSEDSYFLIKNGSTLQIGSELLEFEVEDDLTLNNLSQIKQLFKTITDTVKLTNVTDSAVTFTLKKGSVLAVGQSQAELLKDVKVTLTNAALESALSGSLSEFREAANGSADDLLAKAVHFVDTLVGKADGQTVGVEIEFLEDHLILRGQQLYLDGLLSIQFNLIVPDDMKGLTANLHYNLEDTENKNLHEGKEDDIQYSMDKKSTAYDAEYNKLYKGVKQFYFEKEDIFELMYPNICSGQMTESVTLTILDGSGNEQEFEYKGQIYTEKTLSVRDYALLPLADAKASQSLKDLMKAMLNYGEQAQKHFNYNMSNLALDDYEGQTILSGVRTEYASKMTAVAPDATHNIVIDSKDPYDPKDPNNRPLYRGMQLNLEGETSIYLNFNQEITAATVDGKEAWFGPTKKNDGYMVKVDNIASGNLSKLHTITVTINNTEYTYKASALTYCNNVLNASGAPEELKNLCRSIYLYSEAADTFFETSAATND